MVKKTKPPRYTSEPPVLPKETEPVLKKEGNKKKEPTDKDALKGFLVIGVVIFGIASCVNNMEDGPNTQQDMSGAPKLAKSKAMELCREEFHKGAIYGADVSALYSTAFEDAYHWTVYTRGTTKNAYGTEIKSTMQCLVNKIDKAVTSSNRTLGY